MSVNFKGYEHDTFRKTINDKANSDHVPEDHLRHAILPPEKSMYS